MIETPAGRGTEIPPAFYRDDELPPPPPDDPHWREWSYGDWHERVPRWIMYGLPAMVVCAAIFHSVLIFIVLKSVH